MAKKRSSKGTPIVFALFRMFSHFFDRFHAFSLVFALFGLSVSERFWPSVFALFRTIRLLGCHFRRRTNVQQLTCNINLSCSFIIFSSLFVLIELKPLVLKGKVLRQKF